MPDPIWTPEQIASLQKRQEDSHLHPYTCRCHSKNLKPTENGWVCPETGKIIQTWAHAQDFE